MVQKKKGPPPLPGARLQAPRRGRGRPPAYDPEVALDKAQETFWKRGYAATSLDELSAATGMNRPSLYNAFGDKRALYLKTLERYRAKSNAAVAEAFTDGRPLRQALRAICDALLAIWLSGDEGPRGCYLIGTAVTEAATEPAVREQLLASMRSSDAGFARLIERGAARGEVRPGSDPAALGRLAAATVHTLALRARIGTPPDELAAVVEALVDTVCGPE
ncbi:transcriptional regulator, TetR family [Tistlia consotensis]|uniref:Transcriptional regulator, TetR family n=1 Tax=Tistlia consotensis USBA 355 TaxID=560819 RepID=A0A1Y6CNY2_9PROT|nr:TetR/AcrR family transcriptional regulator [Tistlia consotensis]SMF77692.1 transcriptional regulator, TetR family [Tistlia consotensis USBA 355]SNS20817.1 transcriptional regulator, TetR family [Tistlia consotensis]